MRSKVLAVLILAAASLTLGARSANAQAAFRGSFSGPHGGMSFRSGGFANHGFAHRSFVSRRSFDRFPDRRFALRRPFFAGFPRRHFVSRRFFVAFPFPHFVVRRVFLPVPVVDGPGCGY